MPRTIFFTPRPVLLNPAPVSLTPAPVSLTPAPVSLTPARATGAIPPHGYSRLLSYSLDLFTERYLSVADYLHREGLSREFSRCEDGRAGPRRPIPGEQGTAAAVVPGQRTDHRAGDHRQRR